jgi:hypothetical protein
VHVKEIARKRECVGGGASPCEKTALKREGGVVEEIAHKREWEVEPVCVEKVSKKRARLSQSVWRREAEWRIPPQERG